ncbi:hypothetical protein DYB32_001647 [Aphanomyces invadans]|uniref:Ubiquitin-like domain-containing protein n=1 Tax=Aphanomyces invadans TaxID=157072 RepID=A0A418B5K9_9STRA|nr:hypothetical protein DYB32_001647 [Aphanomyces invadans]
MESTTGDSTVQSSPSMREASTSSDAATSGVVQMAIDVTQVAPAGNASSVIALNVKTVDQRQFQINLLASSSVPQLKTKIEHETGVVTDRQRLIFRGKVLKNENNLAHYALENGHTLHLVIRPADASNLGDFLEQQLRRSDSFSTLLAEMRQFGNVTTSPSTSGDGNGIEFEATIPILIYPTQQGASPSQPPTGRRWDFESFGQHVVQTLSAVDLFGVLAGSRDALLRFVQHVGVQMIDGNALPSMAPGTNRDWSNQMMSAFRDYVDSLPRFNHPMVPPSTNLMTRIVQSMSPFAAELVVFFIRGTNVEPANAASFLDSFCTFVGHMTRQVVADMLALLSVPSALERVLEDLLTHLGVAVTTARFVVQAFVTVPGVQTAMASIPSQQHASARRPTPDPEGDGPALKRSRQE